jgi:predicted RNA-binding Zn-ribbon protein involved in translation (DUF1610 family)
MIENFGSGNTWHDMSGESCPHCGEMRGFRPVQRVDLGPGARHEWFVCDQCGEAFEREEARGWLWVKGPDHRTSRSA